MNSIEATTRIMESLNLTGKLVELNTGQIYDLAESFHNLFNQKPKPPRKTKSDLSIEAQAPLKKENVNVWD